MKRRQFVKNSLLSSTALSLGCRSYIDSSSIVQQTDTQIDQECLETPSDQVGPYYREELPERSQLNLYGEQAIPFQLKGTLRSSTCTPFSSASIHIWHANSLGEYDVDSEDFRYYGQTTFDSDGAFVINTIYPGAYLNNPPDIYRPRHFHIKILIDGVEQLTTQLYFDNDSYLSFEQVEQALILEVIEDQNGWFAEYDFVVT